MLLADFAELEEVNERAITLISPPSTKTTEEQLFKRVIKHLILGNHIANCRPNSPWNVSTI